MNLKTVTVLGATLCSLFALVGSTSAQGTAFTYQGQLGSSGQPANGSYDLQFTLYSNVIGGLPIAVPATNIAVPVNNGFFTTTIDFGPGVFKGGNVWLDIAVRTNGAGAFIELLPRQQLAPTPYSIYSGGAGSVPASGITGTIQTANLPAPLSLLSSNNGANLTNVPDSALQTPLVISNISGQTLIGVTLSNLTGNTSNMSLLGGSGFNNNNFPNNDLPAIGWDSFYSGINGTNVSTGLTNIYCSVSEFDTLVYATNLLNDGMLALAGGEFTISIGDGWQGGRDSSGTLYANPVTFPDGMPWLIRKLHSMGFKARLYVQVGNPANGDRISGCVPNISAVGGTNLPGDAFTFASWGLDSLDVDEDIASGGPRESDEQKHQFHEAFANAIKMTARPMVYYLHTTLGNYTNGFQPWMCDFNCQQPIVENGSWSRDEWQDTIYRWYTLGSNGAACLSPGHWLSENEIGITPLNDYNNSEGYFLLSCAAMYQGPIFWAADPLQWFGGAWAPFATNKIIRRIQTDSLYIAPGLVTTNGASCELWSKPLSDGTTALFFINRSNSNETITFNLSAVGVTPGASAVFTNVWAYTNCIISGVWTNSMAANSVQLWQMNPNPAPNVFTQFTLSNYNTVLGSNNTVTGTQDTIYGYNDTSQSAGDTLYGANDTATGPYSLVLGYNENDGGWNSSVMIGTSAGAGDTATYYGQIRFWNNSPYTSLWLEGNEVWSNNTFFGHLSSTNVVAAPWIYTNFGNMTFGPFYTNLTGFNAEVDITFGFNPTTNSSGLADQIIVYDPNAPASYSPWTNFVGCGKGATNSTNLTVPQPLPPGGYLTVRNQDAGLSVIQTNRIVAH